MARIGENQRNDGSISTSFAGGTANTFSPYHFSTFLALETPITIIPRFSMPAIPTLSRSLRTQYFGPFSALYPVEVPLYLALYFRLTGTCTVTLPAYLRRRFLRTVLEKEQADHRDFQSLPFYFFEVAKKILDVAADRIRSGWAADENGMASDWRGMTRVAGQDGGGDDDEDDDGEEEEGGTNDVWSSVYLTEVGRLVQDIHLVRQQKLQKSMGIFESSDSVLFIPGIKLTNLVAQEIEFLRHSFAVVLQQACHLDQQRRAPIEVRRQVGRGPQSSRTSSEYSYSTTPLRRSVNPKQAAEDDRSSTFQWSSTSTTPQRPDYSSNAMSKASSSFSSGLAGNDEGAENSSLRNSGSQRSFGHAPASSETSLVNHQVSSLLGTVAGEISSGNHRDSSVPLRTPTEPEASPTLPPYAHPPPSSHVIPTRKRRILRQN